MTIGTYAQLQTAVATWLQRDNLAAVIPDIITLGEGKINIRSRLMQQETTAAVSLTSGLDYAALPTGFLEYISLTYDTDDYVPEPVPIKTLDDRATTSSGKPRCFSISDKFYFSQPADQTYALTSRHYKKWDIASDSTNWLLTNFPGAYLMCSLAQSGVYMKHPNLPVWRDEAEMWLDDLEEMTSRNKSKSALRTEAPLSIAGKSNIRTDF